MICIIIFLTDFYYLYLIPIYNCSINEKRTVRAPSIEIRANTV